MALALLLVSGGFGWLADDGGVFFRLARRQRPATARVRGFWLARRRVWVFFPDSPTTVGGFFHPTALPSRGGVGCVARLADSPQSLSHPLIKNGLNEDSNLRPLGYEPNTLTTTPFSLD